MKKLKQHPKGFTKEYEKWLLNLLNKEAIKLLKRYYAKIYN